MLKIFLKNKMEIEMEKYDLAERSFNRIKMETGISDANEMVGKFLHRE